MFIQDPDLDFLPIPDPGVKKALDPESATGFDAGPRSTKGFQTCFRELVIVSV
jgi:hypothetical protein